MLSAYFVSFMLLTDFIKKYIKLNIFKGVLLVVLYCLIPTETKKIHFQRECSFYQKAVLGEKYYIYNPGYPKNYQGKNQCRWIIDSPANTILQLYCEDFHIKTNSKHKCDMDVMLISPSGDHSFKDSVKYCGGGKKKTWKFSTNSKSNKFAIAFLSHKDTETGRFSCVLTAIPEPTCDCGLRNSHRTRIIGGTDTSYKEYPMMAGLVDYKHGRLFCGATIISRKYLLTSAHCVKKIKTKHMGVIVGYWDISFGKINCSNPRESSVLNISKIIVHKDYDKKSSQNDIALIKVNKLIEFGTGISPVCLPFLYNKTNFEGSSLTQLGWGLTAEDDNMGFNILQKANTRRIAPAVCEKAFHKMGSRQFCLYTEYKGACHGDSGGPVLWQKDISTRVQLLGVITKHYGCGKKGKPTIVTDIIQYIPWIRRNTKGEQYCEKI